LKTAAIKGHKEILQIILDHGVDIKFGDDAFKNAALYGHKEIVEILLDRGVDTKGSSAERALSNAMKYCNDEVVALLLDRGIDIKEEEERQQIFSDYFGSVRHRDHKNLVSILEGLGFK